MNIIYIMSDDHAYQAISAYGYGLNNTPHIDKLAEKGMSIQPGICYQFHLWTQSCGNAYRQSTVILMAS